MSCYTLLRLRRVCSGNLNVNLLLFENGIIIKCSMSCYTRLRHVCSGKLDVDTVFNKNAPNVACRVTRVCDTPAVGSLMLIRHFVKNGINTKCSMSCYTRLRHVCSGKLNVDTVIYQMYYVVLHAFATRLQCEAQC
jgi:hypothetical protein